MATIADSTKKKPAEKPQIKNKNSSSDAKLSKYQPHFGMLHSHTGYVYAFGCNESICHLDPDHYKCQSEDGWDGKKQEITHKMHAAGCLRQAFEHAREKAEMDFLAITEHARSFTDQTWTGENRITNDYNKKYPHFNALCGFELTFASKFIGHLNTFNVVCRTTRHELNRNYFFSDGLIIEIIKVVKSCLQAEIIDAILNKKNIIDSHKKYDTIQIKEIITNLYNYTRGETLLDVFNKKGGIYEKIVRAMEFCPDFSRVCNDDDKKIIEKQVLWYVKHLTLEFHSELKKFKNIKDVKKIVKARMRNWDNWLLAIKVLNRMVDLRIDQNNQITPRSVMTFSKNRTVSIALEKFYRPIYSTHKNTLLTIFRITRLKEIFQPYKITIKKDGKVLPPISLAGLVEPDAATKQILRLDQNFTINTVRKAVFTAVAKLKNKTLKIKLLEAMLASYLKLKQKPAKDRENVTRPDDTVKRILSLIDYYDWVGNQKESITQFNHPYPEEFGNFFDFAFYEEARERVFLVEVANCGWYEWITNLANKRTRFYDQYDLALRNGWKVAPSFNEDNHCQGWGTWTQFRTVVLTPADLPELNAAALYKAIKQRHVYGTDYNSLAVEFKMVYYETKDQKAYQLNAFMGDDISPKFGALKPSIRRLILFVKAYDIKRKTEVFGDWTIIFNNSNALKYQKNGKNYLKIDFDYKKDQWQYLYAKFLIGNQIAITAPIWLNYQAPNTQKLLKAMNINIKGNSASVAINTDQEAVNVYEY